jgi:hypothetical protein
MEVEIDSRLVIPLQGPTHTPRRCTHTAGAVQRQSQKLGASHLPWIALRATALCGAHLALLKLCPLPTELASVATSSSGMRMHDLGKAACSLSSAVSCSAELARSTMFNLLAMHNSSSSPLKNLK